VNYCSTSNAIAFDNVRNPKNNITGQEERGFDIAMKTLEARCLILETAYHGTTMDVGML
jgi:alkylation response protein AidB-like acyl-CoA dehydrogenase